MTNWIYIQYSGIFKCSEGMVLIGRIGIKRNMIWSGMILIYLVGVDDYSKAVAESKDQD